MTTSAQLRPLESFPDALWLAARAGGDWDTLCDIVGAEGIPSDWLSRREVLPEWHFS